MIFPTNISLPAIKKKANFSSVCATWCHILKSMVYLVITMKQIYIFLYLRNDLKIVWYIIKMIKTPLSFQTDTFLNEKIRVIIELCKLKLAEQLFCQLHRCLQSRILKMVLVMGCLHSERISLREGSQKKSDNKNKVTCQSNSDTWRGFNYITVHVVWHIWS